MWVTTDRSDSAARQSDDAPEPVAADAGPRLSPRARRATTAGLLLLAVALPVLRQRNAPWHSMFAEDGAIYAEQAVREGPLQVLIRGYAGYLQLPPRLLAVLTPLVPTDELVRFMVLAGAITGALLAWFAYMASSSWVSSRVVRLALASGVVLMDVVGWEVTGNITNTIWLFLAVLPLALLCTRTRPRDVALCAVVAFLAATSTALAFVFVPLALGFALIRRARSTWVITGAYALGLVLQGAVVLASSDTGKPTFPNAVSDLAPMVGVRVSSVFVFGTEMSSAGSPLWLADGRLLAVASVVVLAAVLVVLLRGAARKDQAVAITLIAYAVLVFLVPVWGRGTTMVMLFGGPSMAAGTTRFSVVPVFLLSVAVAILVDPVGARVDRVATRVGRPLFVVHAVLLASLGFAIANPSFLGLSWRDTVEAARVQSAQKAPSDLVTLPTTTIGSFPVTLPSADI